MGQHETQYTTTMRTLARTHPWIAFEPPSFDRWSPRHWLALGEAQSKCAHLAGVPLLPKFADRLHQVYLAKGVHATTAIEGNTLSERQVLEIVEGKARAPQSLKYLEQEVTNVVQVANDILSDIEAVGARNITVADIKKYNSNILSGLELEDHVIPGHTRKVSVGVRDYLAPPWELCDDLLALFCNFVNSHLSAPDKEDPVVYGIIKAIYAHVYFAWIHPFGDGNGRTARMLEVRFLMEAGVPSSAIHLLSNHYNRTRSEYYRRLSEASKNGGDLSNFVLYATRGFVDQLRDQLRIVRRQQWHVAWVNYIYDIFGDEKTIADKRQICLLLALSTRLERVAVNKLKYMTPRLAEMYAGKTTKTLTRDLNNLERLDLVDRSRDGVRAKKEIILQFLPRSKKGDRELHFGREMKVAEPSEVYDEEVLALFEQPLETAD